MKKNIIIKVSGDLILDDRIESFIKEKSKDNFVVLLVGGGTKISKELEDKGYGVKFKSGIRIHSDFKSRRIARDILEDIETEAQDKYLGCYVISPYIYIGRVLCHINGDDFLKVVAPSFDESYCLTLKGRSKNLGEGIKEIYF